MSSTSAPGAAASISRMLSVTSITANLSPKDYALTNFLALQFFHIMIAASCTEIILERLKLGFSNLRDKNCLQSNPRWPLHIVLQLVKKCWPKNHTDFTTKLLNPPVPRSHQSLPQPSSDSGLSSRCRFHIYQKKRTLEPTLPETHKNANLSNNFEVLSILKTSKPHKTILR